MDFPQLNQLDEKIPKVTFENKEMDVDSIEGLRAQVSLNMLYCINIQGLMLDEYFTSLLG
jgi:hypothetical protein